MTTTRSLTVAPEAWQLEAIEAFVEAFYEARPISTKVIEENTIPSWLWRKRPETEKTSPETNVLEVFERIVGSATYYGWKKELWNDELEARAFYENLRVMLTERIIAIKPSSIKRLGLDWAYGSTFALSHQTGTTSEKQDSNRSITFSEEQHAASAQNSAIDSIVSNSSPELKSTWRKFLHGKAEAKSLTLNFTDTTKEWGGLDDSGAPRLVIDLLKFYRDDRTIDLAELQKAVRLAVVLLELHYDNFSINDPARALAIGHVNLAPLLMALTIPYDSVMGRATAASISAIITAEAVITSAELAGALGPCPAYADYRDTVHRVLRNHRRAVYGEKNDYERISILPVSLDVEAGADLVLIAAARRLWDDAIVEAQKNGLRHLQLTSLYYEPAFTPLLECTAHGIDPERHLVRQRSLGPDVYHRVLHPAVIKALMTSGCDPSDIKGITDYAVGYSSLRAAPGINHTKLAEKGFDVTALAKLENYLPHAGHIRQAFTPWILGVDFCRRLLKIDDKKLFDPHFDLLEHLGFSANEIDQANAFCCGHKTVLGAKELPQELYCCFAAENLTPDSQIGMAAAVQSMVTGHVDLTLFIPATASVEDRENLVLEAWMKGMKNITLAIEGIRPITQTKQAEISPNKRKPLLRKVAVPLPLPSRSRTIEQMTSSRSTLSKAKAKAPKQTVSIKLKPNGTTTPISKRR